MWQKRNLILLLIPFFGFISCTREKHFITDKNYRRKVEKQFEAQEGLAKNRSQQLFKVFDRKMTLREKEALKFLYAFMPLSDLADYNGEFYLSNIRASFAARDTFSWGKTVPEDIFRHFVLPVRVNNENLDSARWIFFTELKGRIKKKSMKDAVLEINHWCHEKVTYKGTDNRTSSPLATVKTAFGRCGEESTFTVAALRSVGIPARQCYTPRWAHTDDNHAWVEVCVDGNWHYLGACEPEYCLDRAWFTAPAKRAMLVNTNVFGDYQGPEDVLIRDQRYTKINILPNYTATKRIFVKVLNEGKKPVDSAIVEFQLYNYAEFYPLMHTCTGKNGVCSFLTGYGDLIIWAARDHRFGYRKVTVKTTDTAVVELSLNPGKEFTEYFDLVPPPEMPDERMAGDSANRQNARRLAFEDRIRSNYEQTFIDSAKTTRLAQILSLNADTLWKILRESRGNWRDLINFIGETQEFQKKWIFPLLTSISEKDLRDITPEVLTDNLENFPFISSSTADKALLSQYVLSPRVDNEGLKPYKSFLRKHVEKKLSLRVQQNPRIIADWIRENIRIDDKANYALTPLTPIGVYELKVSDSHSRNIFFVAFCRSFGIPARLEPATKTPQYYSGGKWNEIYFGKTPAEVTNKGTLVLENDLSNDHKPEYYVHFTLGKYEDGFYRSLDYETDPLMKNFPAKAELLPGSYVLVTGNRINKGTVLAKLVFFNLDPGKTRDLMIELRKNAAPQKMPLVRISR
jgi:transglutaminase-like putative cysteine protease